MILLYKIYIYFIYFVFHLYLFCSLFLFIIFMIIIIINCFSAVKRFNRDKLRQNKSLCLQFIFIMYI